MALGRAANPPGRSRVFVKLTKCPHYAQPGRAPQKVPATTSITGPFGGLRGVGSGATGPQKVTGTAAIGSKPLTIPRPAGADVGGPPRPLAVLPERGPLPKADLPFRNLHLLKLPAPCSRGPSGNRKKLSASAPACSRGRGFPLSPRGKKKKKKKKTKKKKNKKRKKKKLRPSVRPCWLVQDTRFFSRYDQVRLSAGFSKICLLSSSLPHNIPEV